ncbi:MAG: DUF2214 domain-containing protein [Pseudoalteromonas distincta]
MADTIWLAVQALPPAEWLRESMLAYLLMNATHIVGLGLLLGCILALDVRLLGGFASVPLASLAQFLSRMAAAGLLLAVASGVCLFMVNAPAYVQNNAFLAKLGLIAVALANVLFLRRRRHWALGTCPAGRSHQSARTPACTALSTALARRRSGWALDRVHLKQQLLSGREWSVPALDC